MKHAPEICNDCRREIRTLERCIVNGTGEMKRGGQVTHKESVSEGLCCMDCATDARESGADE